jgi:hypothetical protein
VGIEGNAGRLLTPPPRNAKVSRFCFSVTALWTRSRRPLLRTLLPVVTRSAPHGKPRAHPYTRPARRANSSSTHS